MIELTGDVDRDAEAALDAAYAAGRAGGVGGARLHGRRRTSTRPASRVIVGLLARARANGQTLSARGLTEHYRQIFEITRLADFMTILDGREEE